MIIMAKRYDLSGNAREAKLPEVFSTPYRPDVIKRAVLAVQSAKRQPYGTNVLAGKRSSAHYHGRRKYRFTMMNRETARISRIHGKVGYLAMRARVVPQAVKGRKAHPPKAEKIWLQAVNKKEMKLAIKSAIAATSNEELVRKRGHSIMDSLPIIVEDNFENMKKSKEVVDFLKKISLDSELKRCEKKKVRAGKGKTRSRKYKTRKGLLVIVSKKCDAINAGKNLPGVDVLTAGNLNIEELAPGTQAGRLALITESAMQKLQEKYGE